MFSRFFFPIALIGTLLFSGQALASSSADTQSSDMRQLLQLAEYVGVDYSEAVANGEVINPDEYSEMTEFAGLIGEKN